MTFQNFVERYKEDRRNRIKDSTWESKGHIIRTKLLPYFGRLKKKSREMLFWTKDEYLKFIDAMMDKPLSFYAFEMLYWCGIREGELLALTPEDFDFDKRTVTISKTFQHTGGKDIVTPPKTEKSNRTITMPLFLADEIQEYLKMQYDIGLDDRLFPITKSYLYREMQRGCKDTGVKRIRIHDLRHPYVKHTTKKFITFFEVFRAPS